MLTEALAGAGAKREVSTARQGRGKVSAPALRIPSMWVGKPPRVALRYVLTDQHVRAGRHFDTADIQIT